jgi:lipopolysaccharide transport system permease protein
MKSTHQDAPTPAHPGEDRASAPTINAITERSLWSQRELLWQFTQRNIQLRHKGSHLGLAWSILNPLLLLGLYVYIFGYIFEGTFGRSETKTEYALAIFLGLSLVHFIGETIGVAPSLIAANPNFVKKVVFPLKILPAAAVGASLFHLLISIILIFAGVQIAGDGLKPAVFILPVILFPIVCLALGLAWSFAAIGVFLRDINQVTQFISMVILFASAVFYPASSIPPEAWEIMRFNPLLLGIEMARDVVLWDTPINVRHLAYLYIVGCGSAYLGSAIFQKLRPVFADAL